MRVVVIGGGPAGSVTAARLRQHGVEVVVLEKETFPRFHLGESLLPKSLPILETIGVLPAVAERFIPKFGARFHDDIRGKKDRFAFDGAWKPEPAYAFQVERSAFDALLLDHARSLGADVRQPCAAKRIVFEGDRAVAVETTDQRIDADFVIDASGRDLMRGTPTEKIDGLDQTSIYMHYTGIPRACGAEEGDVDIVLFESGEAGRPNWFWVIPFKGTTTSVGAVVSRAWMRARAGKDLGQLFAEAVAASPSATELLRDGTPLWPEFRATADFSYRVKSVRGTNWLAVGDAGGFIDPLFSTGAHLAMTGGFMAAEAIAAGAGFDAWEASTRAAAETFTLAVQAFYRGPLIEHLFTENKRTPLRRSITSLLAGDVYGDSIWLRDARLRIREMA